MMLRLVLVKTTGTKFVFNFRAVLAPDDEIYQKFLPLLTNFKKTFLAVLVLTNAFSGNLEWQISKNFSSPPIMEAPYGETKFAKSLT